jgi:hypothetical protein
VGDSPIPGAGAYADSEIGAAAATGQHTIYKKNMFCKLSLHKGTVPGDFRPRFFALKHPSWAPDEGAKTFSNIKANLRRYSNFSTNESNGPGILYRQYLSKTYMFPNCPTPPLKK